MLSSTVRVGAAIVAAAALTAWGTPAPANASGDWGINGTFMTSSNGEWAKINDRYEKQAVVRSVWTISTTCTSPIDCVGTVTSDLGWTAPLYTTTGTWWIKRTVPNWKYCRDGTPIEGLQVYRIYEVGPDGWRAEDTDRYTGEDVTKGPSGSCGRNLWPVIRMPFFMTKIS